MYYTKKRVVQKVDRIYLMINLNRFSCRLSNKLQSGVLHFQDIPRGWKSLIGSLKENCAELFSVEHLLLRAGRAADVSDLPECREAGQTKRRAASTEICTNLRN